MQSRKRAVSTSPQFAASFASATSSKIPHVACIRLRRYKHGAVVSSKRLQLRMYVRVVPVRSSDRCLAQKAGKEQRNLCSPPASRTNGNRLINAFSRTLEPAPN